MQQCGTSSVFISRQVLLKNKELPSSDWVCNYSWLWGSAVIRSSREIAGPAPRIREQFGWGGTFEGHLAHPLLRAGTSPAATVLGNTLQRFTVPIVKHFFLISACSGPQEQGGNAAVPFPRPPGAKLSDELRRGRTKLAFWVAGGGGWWELLRAAGAGQQSEGGARLRSCLCASRSLRRAPGAQRPLHVAGETCN